MNRINKYHKEAMHQYGTFPCSPFEKRSQRAIKLRKIAAAPCTESTLIRSIYGPLSASDPPTLLPPAVLDEQGNSIKRTYGTLSLPPKLRFVLEENWDMLLKGDVSNPSPELIDYAKWHIGSEAITNDEALHALAKDVSAVGNAPRMAQGFLRLGIAINAPKMIEVAQEKIAQYFLDGFGGRQSGADMDQMKASMLPLTIQNGLPPLAQAILNRGGGANDAIKAIYGLGADNFAGPWIASEKDDSIKWRIHGSIDASAVIGAISLGAQIGSMLPGNETIAPVLHLIALVGATPALLGIAGIPVSRWYISDDMTKPISDIQHKSKAFGLLLKQLKWDFEPDKNKWVSSMLIDAVDIQRIKEGEEASRIVAGLCSTSIGSLLDTSISEGEMKFKKLLPYLDLSAMDEQPNRTVQDELVNKIVPPGRISPLSIHMNRMLDMMHVIKRANKRHETIQYPSRDTFKDTFESLGKDRLQAVKTVAPNDGISGLTLVLPAAHRIGTLGEPGFSKTFKSSADATQFGAHGVNPGSTGFEFSASRLHKRAIYQVLSGSQDHAALAQMQDAIDSGKSPLSNLLTGFQYIGCGISPIGPLAVWSTERNPDSLGTGGLYKDLSDSFKKMLGEVSPPEAGQVDYALRLISATKHYEQFASNLINVYPNNRDILARAQNNLQFFRREMIDTLWNSFTKNLKSSLVNANPVFTYALISMIQEDPEAGWVEKMGNMISSSGVGGNFYDTPGRGIPTTIATLVKYMSEEKDMVEGFNKYGFKPSQVTVLVDELRKTHIFGRLEDFIKHVYGFGVARDKTYPNAVSQPEQYDKFVDMIGRAHTYFDKTLALTTDSQLIDLKNTLKMEMIRVTQTISTYARAVESPERQTYAYNMQKIFELAGMINGELTRRSGCESERNEEILLTNEPDAPKVKGIAQLASYMSNAYANACNSIPVAWNQPAS